MRAKSSNPSILPHWLGLESIQTLRDIVWTLKKHLPKPQKLPLKVSAEAVLDDDEFRDEEEWDKEDVEEIQGKFNQLITMLESSIEWFSFLGQRMLDDDDQFYNIGDPNRNKDSKPESNAREIDGLKFAISTAMLDQEMNSLMEVLDQLDAGDFEAAQSRISELQQEKLLLSEILEILPKVDIDDYKQLIEKDFGRLSYVERWKVYSYWRAETSEILAAEVNSLNVQVLQQTNEMKDVETIETAEIIREAHVVGITTTGAAKNRALLEHLKSKIGSISHLFF
jgi:hypothetical protein